MINMTNYMSTVDALKKIAGGEKLINLVDLKMLKLTTSNRSTYTLSAEAKKFLESSKII